jgi:type II secretory pathway component PulC
MRRVTPSLASAVFAFSLSVGACGGASAPPPEPNAPSTSPAANAPAAPAAPITHVRRSELRTVIAQPGSFLQNVSLDDQPVMVGGKFHGFRIVALPTTWPGLDIAPGDVVTKVNGMAIEHPEEAFDALKSLETAPELRVTYERAGKARELKLPIVDD